MRRALLLALMLLTALRGLVGDAMAYGMTSGMMQQVSHSSVATDSIAFHADSMPAISHFSSEKAASMPCHQVADDPSTEASATACTTCQVCHLAASLPDTPLRDELIAPAQALHACRATSWLNAELQRASKPPIL